MTCKRNILLLAAAMAMVLTPMAAQAGHDARDGDYFTLGVWGDVAANCTLDGMILTATGTAGVPVNPETGLVNFEDEFGWCVGGYSWSNLTADGGNFGDWIITVEDDNALGGPSGAHRTHFPNGEVHQDNFDTCYDVPREAETPDDGVLVIWIDGLLWWALGQPCGEGQSGQGTFGTVEIEHV